MTVVIGRRWTTWKKDNYRLYVWVPESKQYAHVYTWGGYDGFDNNGGDAWTKYINIPITTTPSEYAQYKIVIDATNVTVYSADGTQKSQGAVADDFWANVKSDGSDIRVFDQAKEQLYFWIEEWDYSNQKAVIWVNLTSGSSELNIAYGNPSATKSEYEDPSRVFEFFRDYEDGVISDLTINGGTWSVVVDGTNVLEGTIGYGSNGYANYSIDYSDFVIEVDMNPVSFGGGGAHCAIVFRFQDTNNHYFVSATGGGVWRLLKKVDGSMTHIGTDYGSVATDTWYSIKIVANGDNGNIKVFIDGSLAWDVTDTTFTTGKVGFYVGGATGHWDNIRVLKLADTADFGTPSIQEF